MTRSSKDSGPLLVRNLIVRDLHNKGVTQGFIAKVFGITAARVCQILKEAQ